MQNSNPQLDVHLQKSAYKNMLYQHADAANKEVRKELTNYTLR